MPAANENAARPSPEEGSSHAFEALVSRYWDKLLRVAVAKVKDKDTAFDLVQDIFLTVWEKWQEVPQNDEIEFYLLHALKLRVFNFYRSTGRYREQLKRLEMLLDQTAADDSALAREALYSFREMLLEKAIDQLSPALKQLFILRVRHNYSYKKIAAILDIAPGSARVMYSRALEQVKAYIASQPTLLAGLVATLPLFTIS